MTQVINLIASNECELNLDVQGDYDLVLASVTGTYNAAIVNTDDYVTYHVPTVTTVDGTTSITDGTSTKITVDKAIYSLSSSTISDILKSFGTDTTSTDTTTSHCICTWVRSRDII